MILTENSTIDSEDSSNKAFMGDLACGSNDFSESNFEKNVLSCDSKSSDAVS